MASLSKPVNLPFQIDDSKVDDFKRKIDKQAYKKAIARAEKHGFTPIKLTK